MHKMPHGAGRTPDTLSDAENRDEYFKQYWEYSTNLRNWFIAYGVGGILLLTRVDAVFNSGPHAASADPRLKLQALASFILGLATQVLLNLINKVAHYYAYQKYVVDLEQWRHRAALWLCECFWLDMVLDFTTLAWYLCGTITMARLL